MKLWKTIEDKYPSPFIKQSQLLLNYCGMDCGSALLLSYLISFDGLGTSRHGGVYASRQDLKEKLGLGKDAINSAEKKLLNKGILEIKSLSPAPGLSNTTHYFLNKEKLLKDLDTLAEIR